MYNHDDLIYLAGILDGEGSIGIEHLSPRKNRPKSYYVCRLTVVNTDLILMNWLKDTFEGQFDTRKRVEHHKICHRWHIFGHDLEKVLKAVRPFLKLKCRQADIVLKYRETVSETNQRITDATLAIRKALWLEGKSLNKTGR